MALRDPWTLVKTLLPALLMVVYALSALLAGSMRILPTGTLQSSPDLRPRKSSTERLAGFSETIRPRELPTKAQARAGAGESAIQKNDFTAAEPLLNKVVAADATNYVRGLTWVLWKTRSGKVDESIAAYASR